MNIIRSVFYNQFLHFIYNFNLTGPLINKKELYTISKDENYNSNSYYPFLIHFDLSFINFEKEKYNLTR